VKRIVISPHIDDEVLGCFTILDSETLVVECGVDDFHVVSREERLEELEALERKLKFSSIILNNEVNHYQVSKLINPITEIINDYQPEEIYIPYPSYNQDHQAVYSASLVALRPHDINFFVKRVLVYEETQVFDWDYSHDIYATFKPNTFRSLDIVRKIESYKLLASQVRNFRSPEYLEVCARLRGFQSQQAFAEAFLSIRNVI
jgi:LmbE family N-acetylglucosaminyl deacetylase